MNWLANSISMKKVSLFLLMGLHLDCWETGSGTQRERMSFLPSVQSRISATRSKHSSQESCNQMRWTLPHICYWSVDDFRQIGQCLWLSLLSETLLVNCEFPGAPWMKVYSDHPTAALAIPLTFNFCPEIHECWKAIIISSVLQMKTKQSCHLLWTSLPAGKYDSYTTRLVRCLQFVGSLSTIRRQTPWSTA